MECAICEKRRARRWCPAVRGEICPLCCGTSREMTLDCPFDCEYLREARLHEKPNNANPDEFPNQDIKITEKFLHDNEALLDVSGRAVLEAALLTPGAIDDDIRDALAALIRTYRSLQSGVYYETRPDNLVAGAIYQRIQAALTEFRQRETQELKMTHTRDVDVLGILVFMQRLELDRNNGRKRGRAFVDFLRGQFPRHASQLTGQSLIVP